MVDRLSGAKATLPDLTLIEGRSTVGKASGRYLVLALVTQKDVFPYLENLFSQAMEVVDYPPSYVYPKPEFKLNTEYLEALGLEAMIYEADDSVLDLYQQFRPDDKQTGLVKCWKSAPDDEAAVRNLYDEMVKYLSEYRLENIQTAGGSVATEDLFLGQARPDADAERERIVDMLIEGVYEKVMTATGTRGGVVNDISDIYSEFQKRYALNEKADIDDVKRMAMRRSNTLTARRKLSDLVLESPVQLARFLALYDDRRTSPDSAAFHGALEKAMEDLLSFETAIIDQGELSQKRREAGRETAASLLKDWKSREEGLVRYERSQPEKVVGRMEALSETVDRMRSLDSMFKQAEAVVDVHLKKLKEEEEQKNAPGENPLDEIDKGSNSPFGSLPPGDCV